MGVTKLEFVEGDVIAERYEVLRRLGRGGMGAVYLVLDHETNRELALKTLLPQYITSKHAIARFMREIDSIRQMNHPSIVKIYDAQRIGKLLFYTMDYVRGISIRQWMKQRKRPLGWGSTIRVMALLCDALEHAHQYTIHRDLSPENVMVLEDGSIRLLDFGLAKLTTPDAQQFTMVGVTLGKQEYAAPEQRLSAADVDHRADIFSLGVMLHEMLTGKLPRKVKEPVSKVRPGIPVEVDALLEKALAFNRDDRFNSVREFREALMVIYRNHPVIEESQPVKTEEKEVKSSVSTQTDPLLAAVRPKVVQPPETDDMLSTQESLHGGFYSPKTQERGEPVVTASASGENREPRESNAAFIEIRREPLVKRIWKRIKNIFSFHR